METITKEYKVYDFKELEPEIQEKVIDRMAQNELEYEWWENTGILDRIKEGLLEQYGIECDDVYFDLYRGNYCSLGGARIYDMKKFLISAGAEKWMIAQNLDDKNNSKRIWDIDLLDIGITSNNDGTYNEVVVENNGFIDTEIEQESDIDFEEEIGINLTDFLQDILKEEFKEIQKEEECISSEENIREIIEMNEYKFLENGDTFY